MKNTVSFFNLLIALCIMILVLLVFWFLIARYVHGLTASATVSYMLHTIRGWGAEIARWFNNIVMKVRQIA